MTVNNISPKSPFSDFEKTRTQRQRPTKPVEVKQNQPLSQKQNLVEKTPKEEKNNLLEKAKKLFSTKKAKIIAVAAAVIAVAAIATAGILKHRATKASPELENAFRDLLNEANDLFS